MNDQFMVKKLKQIQLVSPIVISGMPGIGNVGKICADFLIDSLDMQPFVEIRSHNFPNCVFVEEDNTIDLPKLELFYKKVGKNQIILLTGDIQPTEEKECYSLCGDLVEYFKKIKVKEILTLGGVGLDDIPKKPKLFISGSDKKTISRYKTTKVKPGKDIVAGPIVGMSGVLAGLAKHIGIPSVILLAETIGHPSHLGIKGAREIIKVLDEKFNLKIDIKELDKEVKSIEKEIKKNIDKIEPLEEEKTKKKDSKEQISYIG
jgi:uncharacterized protein (TIGR00162 family)